MTLDEGAAVSDLARWLMLRLDYPEAMATDLATKTREDLRVSSA